ncbi:OmpA family protein [Rhodovibrionaceae bacterium A322]
MGFRQESLIAKGKNSAALRLAVLGLVAPLALSACSTVEETYDDIVGTDQAKTEKVDSGNAGQESSYPNLGSVPSSRPAATSSAQRTALQEGLKKNREDAVYVDSGRDPSEAVRTGYAEMTNDRSNAIVEEQPSSSSSAASAASSSASSSSSSSYSNLPEIGSEERPRSHKVEMSSDSGDKPGGQSFEPGSLPNTAAAAPTAPTHSDLIGVIYFGHSSAGLDQRDIQILSQIADYQKNYNGQLRLVGHASQRTNTTDPVAHNLANFDISLKRAQSVAAALKKLGVSGSDLVVEASAANQPVYYEFMPTGEAGNRRTEIYLQY